MFNLVVKHSAWAEGRDSFPLNRMLEYTDEKLAAQFTVNGLPYFPALQRLPTLFVQEASGQDNQVAQVGTITSAKATGANVTLNYTPDPDVPGVRNSLLERLEVDLGIVHFEFSRTHWAVKDADLFRILYRHVQPKRHKPVVFHLPDLESIEPTLVSVMMPFHPNFDGVFKALQGVTGQMGLSCSRADDIWEHPAVMQDVVSLIDRSRVVIADCTGRNPNVFYEIGIAHTLGREVILITQNESDIPFDLRHLRYVPYLNNGQGLKELVERLTPRLQSFRWVF